MGACGDVGLLGIGVMFGLLELPFPPHHKEEKLVVARVAGWLINVRNAATISTPPFTPSYKDGKKMVGGDCRYLGPVVFYAGRNLKHL